MSLVIKHPGQKAILELNYYLKLDLGPFDFI